MKLSFLTTVSASALLAFSPVMAMAQSASTAASQESSINNPDTPDMPSVTQQDIERGWENTKDAVSNAADDVSGAAKDTYEDVKYTLFGDKSSAQGVNVTVDSRKTATGMIGKGIENASGERVGTLKDIIVDGKGQAQLVVVSDADFVDIASKEVAFDYATLTRRDKDGDIIMPLTEESIKNAREFSYDRDNALKKDIRTIPEGGYSVDKLLKADVVNPNNDTVANVDNITFRGGRAENLIVGFNKVLGMGGEKAALAFSDVKLVKDGAEDLNFQLTSAQAASFETFKQRASN